MAAILTQATASNFQEIKAKYHERVETTIQKAVEKIYKLGVNKINKIDHLGKTLSISDHASIQAQTAIKVQAFFRAIDRQLNRQIREPEKPKFNVPAAAQVIASSAATLALNTAIVNRAEGDQWLEWKTAEDDRVCPICRPLDGRRWQSNDPQMPIPPDDTHPNCRCELVPVSLSSFRALLRR